MSPRGLVLCAESPLWVPGALAALLAILPRPSLGENTSVLVVLKENIHHGIILIFLILLLLLHFTFVSFFLLMLKILVPNDINMITIFFSTF